MDSLEVKEVVGIRLKKALKADEAATLHFYERQDGVAINMVAPLSDLKLDAAEARRLSRMLNRLARRIEQREGSQL